MEYKTILVDDDAMMMFIMKKLMENLNFPHEPLCFVNGKEALDYFLRSESDTKDHLLFLDINMPVMNGWEFLDALHEKKSAGNIFGNILTSSVNESDKKKAETYSCIKSFVEKPITTHILKDVHNQFLSFLENRN